MTQESYHILPSIFFCDSPHVVGVPTAETLFASALGGGEESVRIMSPESGCLWRM